MIKCILVETLHVILIWLYLAIHTVWYLQCIWCHFVPSTVSSTSPYSPNSIAIYPVDFCFFSINCWMLKSENDRWFSLIWGPVITQWILLYFNDHNCRTPFSYLIPSIYLIYAPFTMPCCVSLPWIGLTLCNAVNWYHIFVQWIGCDSSLSLSTCPFVKRLSFVISVRE